MNRSCPLCSSPAEPYLEDRGRYFYICQFCTSIFLDPKNWLTRRAEIKRYSLHENNPEDADYRRFVSPVVNEILVRYPTTACGLDFGCGPQSAAVAMLTECGYRVLSYDPVFFNNRKLLYERYDFIICTEVAEHFRSPSLEFKVLHSLLSNGGTLFCMTERWNGLAEEFQKWYYKNDPTHIFFYSDSSFEYIRSSMDFKELTLSGRLAILLR